MVIPLLANQDLTPMLATGSDVISLNFILVGYERLPCDKFVPKALLVLAKYLTKGPGSSRLPCRNTLYCRFALQVAYFQGWGDGPPPYHP